MSTINIVKFSGEAASLEAAIRTYTRDFEALADGRTKLPPDSGRDGVLGRGSLPGASPGRRCHPALATGQQEHV
jgi:hypothetical protein